MREDVMPSFFDRVLEKELKDALVRFERELRRAGLDEDHVKNRIRGARQFVNFLYGRYIGKRAQE
jgi:hypothetical protein